MPDLANIVQRMRKAKSAFKRLAWTALEAGHETTPGYTSSDLPSAAEPMSGSARLAELAGLKPRSMRATCFVTSRDPAGMVNWHNLTGYGGVGSATA